MLRTLVVALGVAMLVIGLLPLGIAGPPHVALISMGALLLIGTLLERVIYKRELDAPPSGEGWERTGEKEGRVRVWYNARTGERAYVRGD